jgi:hypothetical protein
MRSVVVLLAWPLFAYAQAGAGTHELVGQVGSRAALLTLNATQRADASWLLTGEYVLLPTQQRRFVQGESSPEIGVTTLREGDTPILFGRPANGELRGVWRDGTFRGMRYAPGGQERERFRFSEKFPALDAYSAKVRCEARAQGTSAALDYVVQAGKVHAFEWVAHAGAASCRVSGLAQQPMAGGIRLAAGGCRVTFRDLGESLRVAAQGCSEQCRPPAQLEPLLVDRHGRCELFLPQPR